MIFSKNTKNRLTRWRFDSKVKLNSINYCTYTLDGNTVRRYHKRGIWDMITQFEKNDEQLCRQAEVVTKQLGSRDYPRSTIPIHYPRMDISTSTNN